MNETFYTVADVANYLKLSELTIRKYLKEGKLHGVKIGRTWRISDQDIKNFIKENFMNH